MTVRENDFRLNADSIKWHSTLYSFGNFTIRQYDDWTNCYSTMWRFGETTIPWNDVSGKWYGPILNDNHMLIWPESIEETKFYKIVNILDRVQICSIYSKRSKLDFRLVWGSYYSHETRRGKSNLRETLGASHCVSFKSNLFSCILIKYKV